MTPTAKAEVARRLARQVGFDLVGITPAAPLERGGYYRDWLARGYGGSMSYLHRNLEQRADPARLVPDAQSVLCLGVVYGREDAYSGPAAKSIMPAPGAPRGVVAQYARGRDYHVVLHGMLARLLAELHQAIAEPFEARAFVDTGPVLERELAARAGLGWIGKNTCLLSGAHGSYVLLGELVTTLSLAPDEPVLERCGSCTRCIDACPTGALVAPREMNAARCISYLTIEHRGDIDPELQPLMGDRVYGCDICQQVCPYNARAPRVSQPDLALDLIRALPSLLELIELRGGAYRRLTRGTAAHRASRKMWQRNARIAETNQRARRELL